VKRKKLCVRLYKNRWAYKKKERERDLREKD
jgi:hypothetical protein